MSKPANDAGTPGETSERRPSRRRRMLLTGIVAFAGGSFDCSIRNLSESGAKISYVTGLMPPPRFHLILVRDRLVCDAQLVWSKDRESGVAFKARMPLSEITDPALSYLTHLWLARAQRSA